MFSFLAFLLIVAIAFLLGAFIHSMVNGKWTRSMHRTPKKEVTTKCKSSEGKSDWFHGWWSLTAFT